MLAQAVETKIPRVAGDIKTLEDMRRWLRYVHNPMNFLTEFPRYLERGASELFNKTPECHLELGKEAASIAGLWLRLTEEEKLAITKIFTIAVMMGGNKLPGTPASGTEKLFDDVIESFRVWYESRPRTN